MVDEEKYVWVGFQDVHVTLVLCVLELEEEECVLVGRRESMELFCFLVSANGWISVVGFQGFGEEGIR